jgi:GTPase SAR1 family protein
MEVTTLDNTEHRKLTLLSLGDRQVGKTTVLDKYCLGLVGFQRVWSTQGVDVHAKMLYCSRGLIMAEIFDVAGDMEDQEIGNLILRLIIGTKLEKNKGLDSNKAPSKKHIGNLPVHGLLFWFDLSNKHSLNSIPRWAVWVRDRLMTVCRQLYNDDRQIQLELGNLVGDIPIFFIGNKIDKLKDKLAGKTSEVSLLDAQRYHGLLFQYRRNLEKSVKQQIGANLLFTSKVEELDKLDQIILNLYELNCKQNNPKTLLFQLQTLNLRSLSGPDISEVNPNASVLPAFKRELQKQTTRVMKAIWRQNNRNSPDRARSQSANRREEMVVTATPKFEESNSEEKSPLKQSNQNYSAVSEKEIQSPTTIRQRTKTRSKSLYRNGISEANLE